MNVLVTGATGTVGAHVVRALRERGVMARAFVRDREKAASLLGEDVELAVGDFADRGSIERALRGTEALFLACGNVPGQIEHESAAIDATKAAGVQRVVKLSGPRAAVDSRVALKRAAFDACRTGAFACRRAAACADANIASTGFAADGPDSLAGACAFGAGASAVGITATLGAFARTAAA